MFEGSLKEESGVLSYFEIWNLCLKVFWDPNMKFETENLSMNVFLYLKFKFEGILKTVVDDWSSLKAWNRSLKLVWKPEIEVWN